jgi:drug/metabolite transporter (DMT)-like permease
MSDAVPTANSARLRAILLTLAGVLVLCVMDGVIKHLVKQHDTLAVTLGRYVFGSLFAAAIWIHAGRPGINTEMLRAHGLRGILLAGMSSAFFYSLSVLQLAEAVTLFFIAPLLIPIFARFVLHERIRARSIVACLVGLSGVVVAGLGAPMEEAHPERPWGIAAVLGAAVGYALSMVLLRARVGRDGAPIVGLLAAVIPGLILAGPTMATASMPGIASLPAFVAMGALGAAGLFLLAKGYGGAEAQVLAPLEYTGLVWAALIGYAFFDETPHVQMWAGAGLIICACLWGTGGQARPDATSHRPA